MLVLDEELVNGDGLLAAGRNRPVPVRRTVAVWTPSLGRIGELTSCTPDGPQATIEGKSPAPPAALSRRNVHPRISHFRSRLSRSRSTPIPSRTGRPGSCSTARTHLAVARTAFRVDLRAHQRHDERLQHLPQEFRQGGLQLLAQPVRPATIIESTTVLSLKISWPCHVEDVVVVSTSRQTRHPVHRMSGRKAEFAPHGRRWPATSGELKS